MEWHQIKEWAAGVSGLHMDALHVHIGVLAQLAIAAVLRKRLSSIWPWLAVAAVTFANEAYDLYFERWPDRSMQYPEGAKDIWNTLLLPTLLLLLARYTPGLFTKSLVADSGKLGESGRQPGE